MKHRLFIDPRGLEQWTPISKYEFPMIPSSLSEFSNILGLWETVFDSSLTEKAFHTWMEQQRVVTALHITKIRDKYDFEGVQAEYTRLRIGSKSISTIAFEHEDPNRVIAILKLLGIQNLHNENYPQALKNLIGYEKEKSNGN